MCREFLPRAVPEFANQEREKVYTPEGVDSGSEGVDKECGEDEELVLDDEDEELNLPCLVDGKDASDEGVEVLASVRDGLQGECEECLDLPPVKHGRSREELVKATKEDKSLVTWKKLADRV